MIELNFKKYLETVCLLIALYQIIEKTIYI